MREWISIVNEAMGLELNGYARCERLPDHGLTLIIESAQLANFMFNKVGEVYVNDIQTFQEQPGDHWVVLDATGHQIHFDADHEEMLGLTEGTEVQFKATPNVLRFYTTLA